MLSAHLKDNARPGLFSGKNWDAQNKMTQGRHDYSVTVFKGGGRNVKADEFRLIADSMRRDGPRTHLSFTGNEYAACSELMEIKCAAYSHLLDFNKFRETHSGHDLPPEVIDGYYLMRDALLELCPDL